MLQDLAEILGGNPEESEILDIIEFEHKLTNISVPRYENSVCTLLMNQHSLQDPNAKFGGTLQLHDNTRTKKVSTQDVVSDSVHNAVATCQQNSDASQDASKDSIDSLN